MGEIKNELSWSRTRMSTLHTCKRQYYYQYYLKWGGWARSAEERPQVAYRLSKMISLPMLVGLAVHDAVKGILRTHPVDGTIDGVDPTHFARRDVLSKVWLDAKDERWRRSPKWSPPVFEIYYGQTVPPEALKQLGAKTAGAIEVFLSSPLFAELREEDPETWLAVDPDIGEAPSFQLDGHTVWAIPDFARSLPDGTCEIWDWKTGRTSPHDALQLRSYALYARDVWNVAPEKIRAFGFYLSPTHEGSRVKSFDITEESLAETEAVIRRDLATMKEPLIDAVENHPRPEADFPQIEPGSTCERCFFRELCDR